MKDDLKVTSVRYFETRRGLLYECNTNHKGIKIWYDGMGGITFIEGAWSLIKYYQHLRYDDLKKLIDNYESSMVRE